MNNPTRLFDFLAYQATLYPQREAFSHMLDGKKISYSTEDIAKEADKVSFGLLSMGLKAGDTIGTVVNRTSPDWIILDLGMQQIGVINVPIYPTISSQEYSYIFRDSSVKYVVVGDGDLPEKVEAAMLEIPSLKSIFSFFEGTSHPYWKTIQKDGNKSELDEIKKSITSEQLAVLIYTSGTTGHPKGVMLSHSNIVTNVLSVKDDFLVSAGETALSFLPVCHVFERVAIFAYIALGANLIFTGLDNLGGEDGDLKKYQPHFFTAVPRLLEKVYEKIMAKGSALTGIKKQLFFWAVNEAKSFEYDKDPGFFSKMKMGLADKLIFSKWREALGGRVRGIVTGSAPCPVEILRIFSAAGIPVREGYGLTETSPGVSINLFAAGGAKLGTVGPIVDGVDVRLDKSEGFEYKPGEGEIMVSGPNVMLGYYNQKEKTDEVIFMENGKRWFATGDIGTFEVHNGKTFLKITDRKKELLKTSGGKYVAPGPIEAKFKESRFIDQVMIVGDSQKFVSALIVPAFENLKLWAEKNEIPWTSNDEMTRSSQVKELIDGIIEKYNPLFGQVDQVKKFKLLSNPWEPSKADGTAAELTPTLKLKRRVISEKFAKEIAEMYH
jgi:long-chain acyl-CoA synthetase